MTVEFNKIKNWIESNDFILDFGMSDSVDLENGVMTIRKSQKNIIFSMLHECGHMVIGSKKSYFLKYKSIGKASIDGRHLKSDVYKYDKWREEIEAWEVGYKLSRKIGIKIDKDDYDRYAAKCFKTYIKYL